MICEVTLLKKWYTCKLVLWHFVCALAEMVHIEFWQSYLAFHDLCLIGKDAKRSKRSYFSSKNVNSQSKSLLNLSQVIYWTWISPRIECLVFLLAMQIILQLRDIIYLKKCYMLLIHRLLTSPEWKGYSFSYFVGEMIDAWRWLGPQKYWFRK